MNVRAEDALIFRGAAAGVEVVFVPDVGRGHVCGNQIGGDGVEIAGGKVDGCAWEAGVPCHAGGACAVRALNGEGQGVGAEAGRVGAVDFVGIAAQVSVAGAVAAELRVGGNGGLLRGGGGVAIALVSGEEEDPVLQHRSAEGATVEVLVEDWALPGQREVVAVVEEGVAVILEAVAVKGVGAALERLVDDGAGVAAVLRILRTGDKGDFVQGVGIHDESLLLERAVVDIGTVEQEGIHLGLVAVGRIVAETIRGLDGTGGELLQDGGIAAEERQLLDLLGGVDLEGVGIDLDGLRDGTGVQGGIHVVVIVELQGDAGGLEALEALLVDFEGVGAAQRELGKDEVAFAVGRLGGDDAGAGIGRRDFGAGNHRATGVGDGSMNGSIDALGAGSRRDARQHAQEQQGEQPAVVHGSHKFPPKKKVK